MVCANRLLALLAIEIGGVGAIVLEEKSGFLVADARGPVLIDGYAPNARIGWTEMLFSS